MPDLCPEVHEFIRSCEELLAKLAQGGRLTADEQGVIELAAIELLSKIRPDREKS